MTEFQEFKELRKERDRLLEELEKADNLCCSIRQQIKALADKMLEVTLWR
jgi:hypothetical protein